MKALLLTLLLCSAAAPAHACSFDTDCSPGSRCLKYGTNLYGACSGGINPGNTYDRRPVQTFSDQRYGNTCTSDFDCSIGHSCVKTDESFRGVCQ